MTSDRLREEVARAICAADKSAPNPDATIMLGMRTAKAWEARLPMAEAAITVLMKQMLINTSTNGETHAE